MVPKEDLASPCCRTILTSAVGVMQAVYPPVPYVGGRGVGSTARVLLEMEGRDV